MVSKDFELKIINIIYRTESYQVSFYCLRWSWFSMIGRPYLVCHGIVRKKGQETVKNYPSGAVSFEHATCGIYVRQLTPSQFKNYS